MSTLTTPSARAHEKVTGSWVRDYHTPNRRERFVFYAKQVLGTPIPWLMFAYVSFSYLSRAGLEITAWLCALLTFAYIFVDRFSKDREFSFFRVGSDILLLGVIVAASIGAFQQSGPLEWASWMGGVRWVFLLYLLAYCWELFPGLNQVFFLMIGAASVASGYGIWQHFTGVDIVRSSELTNLPIPGLVYFNIRGFFATPEVFGTLIAMAIPFVAAAHLLADRRTEGFSLKWFPIALVSAMSLSVFWTYRPGIWATAAAGLIATTLLQTKKSLFLLLAIAGFFYGVVTLAYPSSQQLLTIVESNANSRAERQRAQINSDVTLWQESMWIGVGPKARESADYDPSSGNVYFQVLAQYGVLGISFYLLFLLSFLLGTYRIFQEIPISHYWHRVFVGGAFGAEIVFHVGGLYWCTLAETLTTNLFVFIAAAVSYLSARYSSGLVPDDQSL